MAVRSTAPVASQGQERSTSDLVDAARAGEVLAWTELVRRHEGLVRATARSFRLGEADTQDAVQSTWLRLLENVTRLRDAECLPGWLATTTSRECLRILRSLRGVYADDEVGDVADPGPGPESESVGAATAEQLWRAVGQLPPRPRLLVRVLFAEAPVPYADVARTTGMPIGSLGPTRARALTQLRRLLEEQGLGPEDC